MEDSLKRRLGLDHGRGGRGRATASQRQSVSQAGPGQHFIFCGEKEVWTMWTQNDPFHLVKYLQQLFRLELLNSIFGYRIFKFY